jgi:DNA-binding beta-propeller fold protein YncE
MKRRARIGLALCLAAAAAVAVAAEGPRLRVAGGIYADSKGAPLREPEGVACDSKGLLAVADTGNGRIVLFDVRGQQVVPRTELSFPELPYPIRLQIDSTGGILALDGKLRKIGRISAAGEFRGYVDLSGAGGAVVPRSFRLDGKDGLYVLDAARARVFALSGDGKLVREVKFPPDARFVSDLALDGKGTLFLVDSVGRRLLSAVSDATVASPLGGGLNDDVAFPIALAADGTGHVFVADQNGDGIVLVGSDGSFRGRFSATGWKEGLLRYPSAIAVDGKGLVFVADRGNSRVQVFELSE